MSKGPKLTLLEKEHIAQRLAEGVTPHAVAKELRRSPHAVRKEARTVECQQTVEQRREQLARGFEGLAERMVDSISDDDILKLDAYRRTVAAGISTDKMRLLRGESTENLSIHTLNLQGDALSAELERVRAEIKSLTGGEDSR